MSGRTFHDVATEFVSLALRCRDDQRWSEDLCAMRLCHVIVKAVDDPAYAKQLMVDLIEADWNSRLEGEDR